ncbi:uncharacterized protein TNCV_2909921 [Trichonephila clavipes]|nr:uncharacterized protein TNCV_2909921 [Trichonephila clavipes]
MSLPNPVEQKLYDVINTELSLVLKEVTAESIKRAAVEENYSSPDYLLTVSGDGTWKTRGHSSLIGVCTVIGSETNGKGRLTDSLIDKLAHYYGNAIRCNSTSVKEMWKAIWAVWGHSCSTDDDGFVLQIQIHSVSIMLQIILYKIINTNPQLLKLFEV